MFQIVANAQVVLTVQQRVTCGDMCSTRNMQSATVTSPNNNTISSGRAGITAPRPVDVSVISYKYFICDSIIFIQLQYSVLDLISFFLFLLETLTMYRY